jgi:hypothetical protein
MVFKKWHKPVKKGEKVVEKVEEIEVKNEENVGTTVVENEINNEIENELKNVQAETKNEPKWKAKNEQVNKPDDVVWTVWWTSVHMQPRWIRFQKFDAPVPMFMIQDEELRSYLVTKGFWTNVYQKDKEWLESHWADMEMIERLKRYVTWC